MEIICSYKQKKRNSKTKQIIRQGFSDTEEKFMAVLLTEQQWPRIYSVRYYSKADEKELYNWIFCIH